MIQEISSSSPQKISHPPGLYVIFFAETWERFSYYGMRALLVLFLTLQMGKTDESAISIFTMYASLIYISNILGGYIADRILGFQQTLILGAVIITLGHICLAFSGEDLTFYMGLGLIVSGTGFFKSNASVLLGCLYDTNDSRRDAGFSLLYVGIQIGGLLGILLCGWAGETYGWHVGFGLASLGMISGVVMLMMQRHHFGDKGLHPVSPISHSFLRNTYVVSLVALLLSPFYGCAIYYSHNLHKIIPFLALGIIGYIALKTKNFAKNIQLNIFVLCVSMFYSILFFAMQEQMATSLPLFIDRNVDRVLFGWTIPTSHFNSINPTVIILGGGIFARFWFFLGNKRRDLYPATKFMIAFILLGIGFFIVYLGCFFSRPDNYVSISYIVGGYICFSVGELFMMPVIMSLSTKLAPFSIQGTIMAGIMLGISLAYLVSKHIATLAALPEDMEVFKGTLKGLQIYQQTFLHITLAILVVIVFILLLRPWMNNVIKKHEESLLLKENEN